MSNIVSTEGMDIYVDDNDKVVIFVWDSEWEFELEENDLIALRDKFDELLNKKD